ncbi:hypothetical protein IGI04_031579 [Brassica rapa subsp. trilocularis]|uniref:Uncharacterized protein n=1 Tax=Brassica rapa subsp. trilocularis TaxID=1813537 RepID=A0ABQ7LTZ2_BRACM|nr:hypothetical protein IGI04_031579 [Brassica rapa subsp. trilocularis]
MNKFQEILSFVHSTVWKVLFGKVADSIEKGTEHEDEYMISEKELLVYSIREAAANNLKRFAEEFGSEWAMQHLVPQVLDMVTNPHYLHRMMVLRAISLMAPVMGSEITCSKFLPVVAEASKDSSKRQVQCCKTSAIPHPHSRPISGGESNTQCLVDLSEDPDVDVRYFANQALRSIDNAAAAQS